MANINEIRLVYLRQFFRLKSQINFYWLTICLKKPLLENWFFHRVWLNANPYRIGLFPVYFPPHSPSIVVVNRIVLGQRLTLDIYPKVFNEIAFNFNWNGFHWFHCKWFSFIFVLQCFLFMQLTLLKYIFCTNIVHCLQSFSPSKSITSLLLKCVWRKSGNYVTRWKSKIHSPFSINRDQNIFSRLYELNGFASVDYTLNKKYDGTDTKPQNSSNKMKE